MTRDIDRCPKSRHICRHNPDKPQPNRKLNLWEYAESPPYPMRAAGGFDNTIPRLNPLLRSGIKSPDFCQYRSGIEGISLDDLGDLLVIVDLLLNHVFKDIFAFF